MCIIEGNRKFHNKCHNINIYIHGRKTKMYQEGHSKPNQTKTNNLKYYGGGGKEVVQWLKCWPSKWQARSLHPQKTMELLTWLVCSFVIPAVQGWERVPQNKHLARLAIYLNSEFDCQTLLQWIRRKNDWRWFPSSTFGLYMSVNVW